MAETRGSEPIWLPDGTELFHPSPALMMVVAIEQADAFRLSAPEVLFDDLYVRDNSGSGVPDYDIARDGQRFVMVLGARSCDRARPELLRGAEAARAQLRSTRLPSRT